MAKDAPNSFAAMDSFFDVLPPKWVQILFQQFHFGNNYFDLIYFLKPSIESIRHIDEKSFLFSSVNPFLSYINYSHIFLTFCYSFKLYKALENGYFANIANLSNNLIGSAGFEN